MNELVSVLMCVYDTPVRYLKEATESILNQTYDNLEFIIVDDGSGLKETGDYLEAVSKADNRIKLIHNNNNIGLTKSLNIGLHFCKGNYIARMDADDISISERIEKQVQ